MKVYLTAGLTLGIVFAFLMSPALNPKIEDTPGNNFIPKNYTELFSLSFLVSFSLVIILRISSLLNKSKILAKILSKKAKKELLARSNKGDYSGLKREIESFLFSLFLASLLSIMVYFFYRLIFEPQSLIQLPSVQLTFQNLVNYFLFVVLFVISLAIITAIGEGLLSYFGVYPKCDEESRE
ncbi:hypothetical protein HYU07_04945 [Candidatus Woesearchaeota archaeon]|nr:hypothetical protein [Candidatus Woesearchaeota archaeon]